MQPFDFVVTKVFGVDAIEPLNVGIAFVLEGCPVEGCGFFDGEAIGFSLVESLGDRSRIPGDLFGDAADSVSTGSSHCNGMFYTYPTLTQVPPSRLLSTAIVFAPHCPLALLADASPPLPPPITK